jgi:hypothetical protein
MVERKLVALLGRSALPVSHLVAVKGGVVRLPGRKSGA